MTGALRFSRIGPLVLLALAIAGGAAGLRLASLVAPSFPLIDQSSDLKAPEGSVPLQLPLRGAEAPASDPAIAPLMDSTPQVNPESPAIGPAYFDSATSESETGSSSSPSGPATPTSGYRIAPSRFADSEQTTGPLRLVPAQTFPKQPRLGTNP